MFRKILSFVILFFVCSKISFAKMEINIKDGIFEQFPVALAIFDAKDSNSMEFGDKIRRVISNDLVKAGLFRIINDESFLEKSSITKEPVFINWRTINAGLLLTSSINVEDNLVEVKYRIWDPFLEKEIEKGRYKISTNGWRRIAHKIANSIYKKFLGVDGYFDSKILFVAETGSEVKRVKRIAIMDQDGYNMKFLTTGKNIVLSPRFDKFAKKIVYTSYNGLKKPPKVHVLDMDTGKQNLLDKDMHSMSFAPTFSPDGRFIIMSFAYSGSTNIYEMDVNSGEKVKLTDTVGSINTSPCYSSDGRYIAFTSDRIGGRPSIYIMNRDGSGVRKVSNAQGSYYTPVWSPDGNWLAFTKIISGNFYIGIMRPDGTKEKLLTSSLLEEGPAWSPNSRSLIFSRQVGNGNRLYAIDINGYNERSVSINIDGGSQPHWSKNLD